MRTTSSESESQPDLSIVIPAYKEESRITGTLEQVSEWVKGQNLQIEVKIIVEKSPDATLKVGRDCVEKLANRDCFEVVDNIIQRGKGYAVRSGMSRVSGKIRMFMDADLSVPIEETDRAIAAICAKNGPDILIGTRYDGGTIKKKQGLLRRVGSRGYNVILRCLGLTGVSDTQCGFKLFTSRSAEDIFGKATVDGFGFDIELLMLAKKMGYRVDQIPVQWYNAEGSKFDPLTDGPRVLIDAAKVRLKLGVL
jgi:dolichyl-phosphate beta-glucosyltransferase